MKRKRVRDIDMSRCRGEEWRPRFHEDLLEMVGVHFPSVSGFELLSCAGCEDRKTRVCKGKGFTGVDCLACMVEKLERGTESPVSHYVNLHNARPGYNLSG